ncbi:hypothetical protein DUNSADRAFT_1959 [Dunaliella salina]|uniref:Uncharacterized protein n=1 Tax=Dunaliella salina TaxID=3046 RepID=A0ABQ7GWG1_DUNSA|nr:hypothetical protein DUNSADRAFT_1959 [Dunaliella salina]|eukprot:KAF5838943.1 hypothetical protein DUNSADRAFT_1959 [Dunaliella salina]
MPPKRVNLAFAGKKLLGPPEGYDKKKELQIKRWLLNNPPPPLQDIDVAASVSSVSEQAPRPVEPPDRLRASQPKVRPQTSSAAQPLRVPSQYATLRPRPATSTAPQSSAANGTGGRAPLPPPGSKSLELDTTKPPPALRASADNLREHAAPQPPQAAPPSPGPSAVPPSSSEYPDSSSGSGTPSLSPSPGPKPAAGPPVAPPSPPESSPREKALGPPGPVPPLDFVLDGFGLDSALGVLGGNADSEGARQV